MYTPTTKLTAKTSTVRLRVCSRVGQETFFSSDHDFVEEAADVGSRRSFFSQLR